MGLERSGRRDSYFSQVEASVQRDRVKARVVLWQKIRSVTGVFTGK